MAYETYTDTIQFEGRPVTIQATCTAESWPAIRRDIIGEAKTAITEWAVLARENGEQPYSGAYEFDAGVTTLAVGSEEEHSVAVTCPDASGTDRDGGYIHIRGWDDPETKGFPSICRSCGREALDHDSEDRLYCIMCGELHKE